MVIGLFVLCYKIKGMGQLMAIGNMIPAISTAPLNPDVDDDSLNFVLQTLSLLVMSWTIYWCYKHIAFIKKLLKYCVFPIEEFDLRDKPPSPNVLLYFTLPHQANLIHAKIDVEIC